MHLVVDHPAYAEEAELLPGHPAASCSRTFAAEIPFRL